MIAIYRRLRINTRSKTPTHPLRPSDYTHADRQNTRAFRRGKTTVLLNRERVEYTINVFFISQLTFRDTSACARWSSLPSFS